MVPSAVTRGHERNVLINPVHPDFKFIWAGGPVDVQWDKRLFSVLNAQASLVNIRMEHVHKICLLGSAAKWQLALWKPLSQKLQCPNRFEPLF